MIIRELVVHAYLSSYSNVVNHCMATNAARSRCKIFNALAGRLGGCPR
jgi:hypothetical protein